MLRYFISTTSNFARGVIVALFKLNVVPSMARLSACCNAFIKAVSFSIFGHVIEVLAICENFILLPVSGNVCPRKTTAFSKPIYFVPLLF